MSSRPNKEPVDAFLDRYRQDQEAGVAGDLAHYLELFPGDPEGIARAFLRLDGALTLPDDSADPEERRGPLFLGPYRLEEEIGRGGQGVVYRAIDTRIDRTVAVKTLRGLGLAPSSLLRFKREAIAASKTDHPGVCPVYDAEVEGGVPYIAMKFVEGETLAGLIASTRDEQDPSDSTVVRLTELSLDESSGPGPDTETDRTGGVQSRSELWRAMRLVEKVARALHAVHEAGVIHRDVKPGNVMITPSGEAVVMDFGLARDQDSDLQTLTESGDFFGTPAYMSPEQLTRQGIRLDNRTDIWSLGVVLYECITLQRPFHAAAREALYQQILAKEPRDPRQINAAVPADLATVVATALEKDRDRRYQTAADLADDLGRVQRGEPILARPLSRGARLVRWARRHPALAISISVAVLSLVTGIVVSTTLAIRAENKAAEAEANLRDWERLADWKTVQTLAHEAEHLWPESAGKVGAMQRWLATARDVTRREGSHRDALAALRASRGRKVDPVLTDGETGFEGRVLDRIRDIDTAERSLRREIAEAEAMVREWPEKDPASRTRHPEDDAIRSRELTRILDRLLAERDRLRREIQEGRWVFTDARDQIRHDGLVDLIQGIESLKGPAHPLRASIASMEQWLDLARTLRTRSIDEHASSWSASIERIRNHPRYGGLRINPQLGLVPLGPDPESGLEEFGHVLSGALAQRDPSTGKLSIQDGTGLVLILVPGGTFMMGAQSAKPAGPNHDPGAKDDERPVGPVTLEPFLLSKFEMTQGQWTRAAGTNPSSFYPDRHGNLVPTTLACPVEEITAADCDRVLSRWGLGVPTEAQWEYACRAGTSTPWWPGASVANLRGVANLDDTDELSDRHFYHAPVGSYRPNAFGFFDMLGNVREWCRDWETFYDLAARPGDGMRGTWTPDMDGPEPKVIRGGSWNTGFAQARSACRGGAPPSHHDADLGVRPTRRIQR